MDNSELPINKLMAQINAAADNNEPMNLTIEQVNLLAKHYGDLVAIPVYTMDNFPIKKFNKDQNTDEEQKVSLAAGHTFKKASMLGVMAFIALKIRWMLLSVTVGCMGICGVSNLNLIDGYINNLNALCHPSIIKFGLDEVGL